MGRLSPLTSERHPTFDRRLLDAYISVRSSFAALLTNVPRPYRFWHTSVQNLHHLESFLRGVPLAGVTELIGDTEAAVQKLFTRGENQPEQATMAQPVADAVNISPRLIGTTPLRFRAETYRGFANNVQLALDPRQWSSGLRGAP